MKGPHDEALLRWIEYERECLRANTAHLVLTPPSLPSLIPTIVIQRQDLLAFRAGYTLMRNALSELLDLDPETMTQMQVILAVAKKKWAAQDAQDAESGEQERGI
jgi:hypothetical protein